MDHKDEEYTLSLFITDMFTEMILKGLMKQAHDVCIWSVAYSPGMMKS